MPETTGWILDFHTTSLSNTEWLDRAGGKGANLARLAQAGFAVPRGFILQTSAYSAFLVVNDLDEKIQAALPAPGETDPLILENASRSIRDLFQVGCMPGGMAEELFAAYQALGEPPVAVRSSATAEDTLELSFAGQQDTYLNMVGADALQRAVIDCWSSLWTARAIGYRDNHGIPQHGLSLAVVVQCMVPSHSSGVLFTANPLTGLRSETVIDAAYGLGEALVSGKVEPDQYIVDAVARRIEQVTLGAKAVVLRGTAAGGTEWEQTGPDNSQALTDVQILSLTDLGKQIETLYRMPQDIEWALADDQFHILQSRPITSLYPIPAGLSADPLKVLVSFAAVQGLLAPITPLGRDTFLWLFAVGRGLFGLPTDIQSQSVLMEAGERLWINITPLVRNTLGRKVVATALEYIEPTVRQALMEILDDPRLQPERQGISWKGRLQLAHFALPLIGNILLNLIAPARRRAAIINGSEALLDEMRQEFTQIPHTGRERLNAVSQMLPRFLIRRLPSTFLRFVSGVAAGMASLTALNKLAGSLPDRDSDNEILDKRNLVLEITRGMQHNPTTEMDLELWQAASAVQSQPGLMDSFKKHSPAEMGHLWRKDGLPTEVVALVDGFLRHYGSRGLAEIDIGRGRWGEDPTPVFAALSGYLQITDPHQAPDAVFERGEESARAALKQLTGRLRAAPKGWLKARLARFFAGRMRELLCMRESPKFFAVRMIGLLREELLRCGRDLTQSGELDQAGDVFFLTYQELGEFSGSADTARWRERIASRRRAYELEMHRRQIPRMLLSDGRAFYAGIQTPAGAEDRISGSPVSPGSVEGVVRVVLDPHHAGLQPGEIMVCPGTDPSWTPLFLTAGGLIMEVGGMMTHGAVVAREYGIPAVVGVDQATVRLPTGTRIRLDGSSGQVVLLKEKTEVAVE